MKKQLIPGTKIVKVIAGKDNNGEKLRKDLEKIGKIELLGKSIKNIFSIQFNNSLPLPPHNKKPTGISSDEFKVNY